MRKKILNETKCHQTKVMNKKKGTRRVQHNQKEVNGTAGIYFYSPILTLNANGLNFPIKTNILNVFTIGLER